MGALQTGKLLLGRTRCTVMGDPLSRLVMQPSILSGTPGNGITLKKMTKKLEAPLRLHSSLSNRPHVKKNLKKSLQSQFVHT